MVTALTAQTKAIVEEILIRAAKDVTFREELLHSPQEALKNSGLKPEEIEVMAGLKKVKLEEWGIDTRSHLMMVKDNGYKIRM